MKNEFLLIISLLGVSTVGMFTLLSEAYAETSTFKTEGNIKIEVSDKTNPLDPENPLISVDPGEGPSTDGDLRIDFVSTINFSDVEITETNRKYSSLAQLFHTETSARAPYIQITDLRKDSPGWNLQLKQETQFKNKDNIELNGATLSFDKGWANSGGIGKSPIMFRDTISVNEIGSGYQVASAAKGAGNGTWLLSFGASGDNELGQENTLTQLKGPDGKVMIDKFFNKEIYLNSAINLSVPDKTSIVPGYYQTELTWILQATP